MKLRKVQNVIKYRMYLILVVMGLTMLYLGCKNKTQEKHLSDFFDLKNEKFANVDGFTSSPIVQNEKFIFYETDDMKIMRIDKRNQKKTMIAQLNKTEAIEGGFYLSNKDLYYVHDDCLYKSSFDGKNVEKIISMDDIKMWAVNGAELYKGNIYLEVYDKNFSTLIMKLHPETKEVTKVAEKVGRSCFYKNSLYYIEPEESGIHKVDLETLEDKLVRGQRWTEEFNGSDDPIYRGIINHQERLYYIQDYEIYSYEEKKEDKKEYTFSSEPFNVVYNSSIVAGTYGVWDDEKNSYMQLYNITSQKEKKVKLPHLKTAFAAPTCVIDDVVICPSYKEGDDFAKGFKIQ